MNKLYTVFCAGGSLAALIALPVNAYELTEFNGHQYALTEIAGTWIDAENEAKALGAHLVSIGSEAEQRFIEDNFLQNASSPVPYWIGLSDNAKEGSFVWANGEVVDYTNWGENEPNNSGGEDYATINWHYSVGAGALGTWNDMRLEGVQNGPYFGLMELGARDEPRDEKSECWAVLDESGKLHIPCVKITGGDKGVLKYKANMQLLPVSDPLSFDLIDAEAITQ